MGLLHDLQQITGAGKYLFRRILTASKRMSDNTVNAALRSIGYGKEVMTGHGFRAMDRTIMDEVMGERGGLIEQQLAHQVKDDPNGRAYNRTAGSRTQLRALWPGRIARAGVR